MTRTPHEMGCLPIQAFHFMWSSLYGGTNVFDGLKLMYCSLSGVRVWQFDPHNSLFTFAKVCIPGLFGCLSLQTNMKIGLAGCNSYLRQIIDEIYMYLKN